MLHTAEVYSAIAESSDVEGVRGWAEVSRLLADPAARLTVVPADPDDSLLAAFLDPEAWWHLADLDRHAALAARLPLPGVAPTVRDPLLSAKLGSPDASRLPSLAASASRDDRIAAAGIALFVAPSAAGELAAALGAAELSDLLERLGAPRGDGSAQHGWVDGGGGVFPDLGLRGAAKRRPGALAAALLVDRTDPVAALLRAWSARSDFSGAYAAGFLAAGGCPTTPGGFVRAGFSGAAPRAVRGNEAWVGSLLRTHPAEGLAAGRRALDEAGFAIALGIELADREGHAALLAASGEVAAAPRLRDLYGSDADLSPRHRVLYEAIVGRPLDAL